MKVYDSYITINIDSKEKEMLNKIAIKKGKKLSRMIYEEYIKKLLEDENESKKKEESYNQYQEVIKRLRGYNSKKEHKEMYGIVVFSQDNFDKQYSKESRTYVFSNNNEAFLKNSDSETIYGSNLDGTDVNVRIDKCVKEWIIEEAYMAESIKNGYDAKKYI